MSSEAIALWTETSSDPELIAGVRAGDTTAFGLLYERHVDAARKVATQYTNTSADVDDVVSESFSRVLRALQRGDGPDLAFRAYLFTIVRRTGMDMINKGIRTKPRDDMGEYEATLGYEAASDEPALEGFEHSMVAGAFKSLPERWQAVLWYTEVEKKSPKEIAPLLGLSANGVAALAYRAREALRQAYLQQHLNSADTLNCLEANTQLGAYVRGGLNKREHTRVDEHVAECERCTALVLELQDVNRGMRGIIAPLVLGTLGMGALQGGMPIGGVFGAAGLAGGSSSGGAGSGASAAASGGSTATVGASGLAAAFASVSHILLPTAAVVGVAALAVGGLSFLGVFDSSGDNATGATNQQRADDATGDVGSSGTDDVTNVPGADEPEGIDGTDTGTSVNGPDTNGTGASDGIASGSNGTSNNVGAGANGGLSNTANDSSDNSSGTDASGSDTGTGAGSNSGAGGTGTDNGSGSGAGSGGGTDNGSGSGGNVEPPARVPSGTANLKIAKSPLDFLKISRTTPTLSMSLANDGDGAADAVSASINLPEGLSFASPGGGAGSTMGATAPRLAQFMQFATDGTFVAGDWTCSLTADPAPETGRVLNDKNVADCTLDALGAGEGTQLDLPVDLDGASIGDDAKTAFTVSSGDLTVTYEVDTAIDDDSGLDSEYANSGGEDFVQVGAPLMGCDILKPSCLQKMNFSGDTGQSEYNNNGLAMAPLNTAGGEQSSSMTNLVLPEGAVVKTAILEWSANRSVDKWCAAVTNCLPDSTITETQKTGRTFYAGDEWSTPLDGSATAGSASTSAQIRAPGQNYRTVTAASINAQVLDSREYYVARANVTDLVAAAGSGSYALADISLPATTHDPDYTYYGGFALTVVYESADLAHSRVAIFDGAHWVSRNSSADIRFNTDGAATAHVGWVAWEGDRASTGDTLKLDGTPMRAIKWDGANATLTGSYTNAADSTATGSDYANSLGVDAKPFEDQAITRAGQHTLSVSTTGDNFLISTVAVRITDE